MKSFATKVFILIIPMCLCSCNALKKPELNIYLSKNDSLFYAKYDFDKNKLFDVDFVSKLDIYDFNLKNDFLLLNQYEGSSMVSNIYRLGKLIKEINYEITDSQVTTQFKKGLVVIDSTDYHSDGFIHNEYSIRIYNSLNGTSERINIDFDNFVIKENTSKIDFLFHPKFEEVIPNKNWQYKLQILDITKNRISNVDTIDQSNFNLENGIWEFSPENSYWLSEDEVTYLKYKIDNNGNIDIRIMKYSIITKNKEIYKEFKIPLGETIKLKYCIEDSFVFVGDNNNIYHINGENEANVVFESSDYKILGFHF